MEMTFLMVEMETFFFPDDMDGVFYNDQGASDFAVITDFDRFGAFRDKIQIAGSINDYTVRFDEFTGDTTIFLQDDIIALVQGVDATDPGNYIPA